MIQMMQGHALTILSGMPRDALFDAVITDPPYASGAATFRSAQERMKERT